MNCVNIESFIFDLDGTLIDSVITMSEILNQMRKSRGLSELDSDSFRPLVSQGANELISYALNMHSSLSNIYVEEFRERYQKNITPKTSMFRGVTDTISYLKSKKKKLCVCSNKPEFLCKKIIQEIELNNLIEVVVGGDTLDVSKPSREPIDYALKLIGGSHDSAVLIGDSSVDQQSAKSAQIPFIFFNGGYNDGVEKDKVMYEINSLEELIQIF
jgi:phosphoglycolate phosphatase